MGINGQNSILIRSRSQGAAGLRTNEFVTDVHSDNRSQVQINEDNWRDLNTKRENAQTQAESDSLAPLEHYAYARYDVSENGFGQYLAESLVLIPGRELAALVGFTPQTGTWEMSPPSLQSYEMGQLGALMGLFDYLINALQQNSQQESSKDEDQLKGSLDGFDIDIHESFEGGFPDVRDPNYSDGTMNA